MKNRILLLLIFSLIFSCKEEVKNNEEVFHFEEVEFPNSNFHNTIELSKSINKYHSLHPRLDSIQKRHLLPDITKNLPMDIGYLYSSFFIVSPVSKQNKIGYIQPIILHAFADDFSAFILVTLDSNHKPVDYLFVDNEEYCGEDEDEMCEKFTHSVFTGSEILSYNLYKFTSTINNELLYIDSISYKSKINKNGTISTIKSDSVRVNKLQKDSISVEAELDVNRHE